MSQAQAINLLQINERGRQGIDRLSTIRKIKRRRKKEKDMFWLLRKGNNTMVNQQYIERKAAELAQRQIRGILGRKECAVIRAEEMIFLGMTRA